MKILGINASSRKGGNCHTLLQEALKGAEASGYTTEVLTLQELNILPWQESGPGREVGKSPIDDDMKHIEDKILGADAIILASPIYFGSLSAQAKIMIDRCQIFWERKMILKEKIRKNTTKAALICVEASDREDFFENAKQIAKNLFAIIEAKYVAELFCVGLEKPGDVLKHSDFLKKAYTLGKNLA